MFLVVSWEDYQNRTSMKAGLSLLIICLGSLGVQTAVPLSHETPAACFLLLTSMRHVRSCSCADCISGLAEQAFSFIPEVRKVRACTTFPCQQRLFYHVEPFVAWRGAAPLSLLSRAGLRWTQLASERSETRWGNDWRTVSLRSLSDPKICSGLTTSSLANNVWCMWGWKSFGPMLLTWETKQMPVWRCTRQILARKVPADGRRIRENVSMPRCWGNTCASTFRISIKQLHVKEQFVVRSMRVFTE